MCLDFGPLVGENKTRRCHLGDTILDKLRSQFSLTIFNINAIYLTQQ